MEKTLRELIRVSTKEVFTVMSPYDVIFADDIDISSVNFENKLISSIDFSGQLCGTVLIHSSNALAKNITAAMLMSEPDEITADDINDCFGELVNIIWGSLRTKLVDSGVKTKPSIPVVYSDLAKGTQIDITGVSKISQLFIINEQYFLLELFYKKEEPKLDRPKVDRVVSVDPSTKKRVKAEFINPILAGINYGFSQITGGINLQMGKPSVKHTPVLDEVYGVHLGITGDLSGKVLYSFNEQAVFELVSYMFKKKITSFDEMVKSGINEICNIMTGHECSKLYSAGYNCDITPPMMIIGQGNKISMFDADVNILSIPLHFGEFTFGFDIALKENL